MIMSTQFFKLFPRTILLVWQIKMAGTSGLSDSKISGNLFSFPELNAKQAKNIVPVRVGYASISQTGIDLIRCWGNSA